MNNACCEDCKQFETCAGKDSTGSFIEALTGYIRHKQMLQKPVDQLTEFVDLLLFQKMEQRKEVERKIK